MGTGVMIGTGIFALTGQIAELAGPLFPLSFVVGAIVTAFSAYTYIKMSNAFPSAGGIAKLLKKAYGPTTIAAGDALLMTLSMVIFLDAMVLAAFVAMKWQSDPVIVAVGVVGMALVFMFVGVFLARNPAPEDDHGITKKELELPVTGSRKLMQDK